MLKVVVDTNVIVSALLKPESNPAVIVSLILHGRIKLCLSKAIFEEYKGVLNYGKFQQFDVAAVKAVLDRIRQVSSWIIPKTTVETIKADSSDNKFLECALEGHADYIISGDRHLKSIKRFKSIKVLDPAAFLLHVIAK